MNYKIIHTCLFIIFILPATLYADIYIVKNTSDLDSQSSLDPEFIALSDMSKIDTLLFQDLHSFSFVRDTQIERGYFIDKPYSNLKFETTGISRANMNILAIPVQTTQTTPITLGIDSLSVKNTNLHFVNDTNTLKHSFTAINLVGDNSSITLEDADLIIAPSTKIGLRNANFRVKGSNNHFEAPAGLSTTGSLKLTLEGSDLTIANSTDFQAKFKGSLQLENGSTLSIDDSRMQLTANNITSRIEGATVNIDGTFASQAASLELTNPVIKNSTINLGNNTEFRSYIHSSASSETDLGTITFEGNNLIAIGDNALVTANSGDTAAKVGNGSFYFKNGHTNVMGNSNNGTFKADSWNLDNASLNINGVSGESTLVGLELRNKSELVSNNNWFTNLSTLIVDDSKLSGIISYGGTDTAYMSFNNAQITNSDNSKTNGKIFESDTFLFSGITNVLTRIDPQGTELVSGTGIKNYNDAITFSRGTVQGFEHANFTFQAFKPGLSAQEYTTGGLNGNGVYDIAIFNNGATSDSNTLNLSLGGSLPALLKITQVNTPSVDQMASVKFEVLSNNSALITIPLKTNQQNVTSLLVNSANSGNTQVQNHLNTITGNGLSTQYHPEPYSSYMTTSLEYADMIMDTVLLHASSEDAISNRKFIGNKATNFWVDVNYIKGDVDGVQDLGSFDYQLSNITIGRNFFHTNNSFIGAYISLGQQKMDEHDLTIEALDGNLHHLGMYFHKQYDDKWKFDAVTGYGFGEHNGQRYVSFGGAYTPSTSNFNSHSFYAGVKGSVEAYKNDYLVLSPEVGAKYVYYKQDSINESGDPLMSYNIDSADAQSIIASVGLNAQFSNFPETTIYPLAFIRYEHDFYANNNNTHEIKAGLISNPNYKQTFVGQNRGKDIITAGIGIGSEITSALQVSGGITTSKNSNGEEWGAGINFEYRW